MRKEIKKAVESVLPWGHRSVPIVEVLTSVIENIRDIPVEELENLVDKYGSK